MPKNKHLHKYKRKMLGGNGYTVYACIEPACSHYVRIELVENKLCACNRCGNAMIMTKKAMTLAKPHCEDCTKSRKDKSAIDLLSKYLDGTT